jgi:hypothetical protein
MTAEASPESPPKLAAPLSFSEIMNYYFATENALYEERSRNANSAMAQLLEHIADSLRDELTNMADARGVGEDFRFAVRVEQAVEERTLKIRMTADKLNASRLLFWVSAILLLGYGVSFIAYDTPERDWTSPLLWGVVVILVGFCLPWLIDLIAEHEERKLRELRRIADVPTGVVDHRLNDFRRYLLRRTASF